MKTVASQLKVSGSRARCPKAAGLAMLAVLLSTACSSTPKTHYYTLRTPPPPAEVNPQTHFTLQVQRFDVPDLLVDNRIVYFTTPSELNFYEYHRWSSEPGEMLSELAMRFFAETKLFQHVYAYPAPFKTDYTLRGRVLDLGQMKYEKVRQGKSGSARLGLKLDLLQTQQNKIVWSARLEQTAPIEKDNVQAAIEAMNLAAARVLRSAYGSISEIVEHQVAQK